MRLKKKDRDSSKKHTDTHNFPFYYKMAKLSNSRNIGSLILIGLGLYQIVLGIVAILVGNTILVGIIDIFFDTVDVIIGGFAIFNILFGILLFWAGKTIRKNHK